MQVFFLAALAFALLAVVFALQNIVPVRVGFLVWTFEGSLALVLFVALILGALVSVLISIPSIVKGRMTSRSLKAQIAALQAELDTRTRPAAAASASAPALVHSDDKRKP